MSVFTDKGIRTCDLFGVSKSVKLPKMEGRAGEKKVEMTFLVAILGWMPHLSHENVQG